MSAKPLTVKQAAVKLGMQERYVRELCSRLDIGYLVNPRLRLLSAADLPKIKAVKRGKGRPKKVAPEV